MSDAQTVRLVVVGLIVVCCICLVGMVLLAALGRVEPSLAVALGSVASQALGALIGILVSPRQLPSGQGSAQNFNTGPGQPK